MLVGQPQHVSRVGDDGQAVCCKKPRPRPSPIGPMSIRAVYDVRSISVVSCRMSTAGRSAGELSVRVLEVIHGGGRGVAEPVESAQLIPVEDRVKGPLGRGGDPGCGVD